MRRRSPGLESSQFPTPPGRRWALARLRPEPDTSSRGESDRLHVDGRAVAVQTLHVVVGLDCGVGSVPLMYLLNDAIPSGVPPTRRGPLKKSKPTAGGRFRTDCRCWLRCSSSPGSASCRSRRGRRDPPRSGSLQTDTYVESSVFAPLLMIRYFTKITFPSAPVRLNVKTDCCTSTPSGSVLPASFSWAPGSASLKTPRPAHAGRARCFRGCRSGLLPWGDVVDRVGSRDRLFAPHEPEVPEGRLVGKERTPRHRPGREFPANIPRRRCGYRRRPWRRSIDRPRRRPSAACSWDR